MSEHMDEVQLVKVLLDIHLFEDLDYTQITSIIRAGEQRNVTPGEEICSSRTIDESLILILVGKLALVSAEGNKIANLVPIKVLGEMGVFTGQPRSSSVVAEEEAIILEIPVQNLEEVLEEDPQMGNHMMVNLIKLLYTRVHDTNQELHDEQQLGARLRDRLAEVAPDDPLLAELFPDRLTEDDI